ncbi:hypothetical protein NRB20_11430 [Nocardia sp. RB20]|uniref:Uncharacterized protein n=1 Tax=Nocardia macrotermitis TaxID=2585198 RepID=A0A7K0CZH3_9NOCA|nr:hypothetical protein [Nocardia macrotermitis]
MSEATDPPGPLKRIRIESGSLTAEYRASAEQARNVADRLRHTGLELTVTVDADVRPDLPLLPCARLWQWPDHRATGSSPNRSD